MGKLFKDNDGVVRFNSDDSEDTINSIRKIKATKKNFATLTPQDKDTLLEYLLKKNNLI